MYSEHEKDIHLLLKEVVLALQYIKYGEENDIYYRDKISAVKRKLSYMYRILKTEAPFLPVWK